MTSRALILFALGPMAACAVPAGSNAIESSGAELRGVAARDAILAAVEDDVHDHARTHTRTHLGEALAALTDDIGAQARVRRVVKVAVVGGASDVFYGAVTVGDENFLWEDMETDEGSGPSRTGRTVVFDASAHRAADATWVGAHQY